MVCGECGANYIMQDTRAYGCSGHTSGGKYLCGNGVRVKREVAEAALLANIKKRLLSDDMTAYVEKQFRAAISEMGARDDAPVIELELAGTERKISKVLDAIESIGISDSLAERLRELEAEKQDAGERLKAAQIDAESLDALPDLVPVLVERWRDLVAEFEGLAGNPDVEPGELDTARGHLHALLGQVTLKPQDGVLWAYPTLKPEKPTLKESRPLILVAGA